MVTTNTEVKKIKRIDLLENRLEDLEIAVAKGYIENVEDLTAIQNQLIEIKNLLSKLEKLHEGLGL